MMTPDEMRQVADDLAMKEQSLGRTTMWKTTAEICERLDDIYKRLGYLVNLTEKIDAKTGGRAVR